jgi:hypothetical protein
VGKRSAKQLSDCPLEVKSTFVWEDTVLAAFLSSAPLAAPWRELYVMLGTSSAALIGLLFVATSLHLAEISNEEVFRLRSEYTTLILVSTLLDATAILMPQPIQVLGAELLAVNCWGLSFPLTLLSKVVKIPGARGRGGFSIRRAEFFIAGYCFGIVGAAAVAAGSELGMYGVTVSYATLLIASIWNGWMIMQGIGRDERNHSKGQKR